jgi:hypothetical protein
MLVPEALVEQMNPPLPGAVLGVEAKAGVEKSKTDPRLKVRVNIKRAILRSI